MERDGMTSGTSIFAIVTLMVVVGGGIVGYSAVSGANDDLDAIESAQFARALTQQLGSLESGVVTQFSERVPDSVEAICMADSRIITAFQSGQPVNLVFRDASPLAQSRIRSSIEVGSPTNVFFDYGDSVVPVEGLNTAIPVTFGDDLLVVCFPTQRSTISLAVVGGSDGVYVEPPETFIGVDTRRESTAFGGPGDVCSSAKPCGMGLDCVAGVCEESTPACSSDADCGEKERCGITNACEAVACTNSNHCASNQICQNYLCIADTGGDYCSNNAHDPQKGELGVDCGGPCQACNLDACGTCAGSAPYCDESRNTCVSCLNDNHCPNGGQCVAGSCSGNTPTTCSLDSDCNPWEICGDGVCQVPPGGFSDWPILESFTATPASGNSYMFSATVGDSGGRAWNSGMIGYIHTGSFSSSTTTDAQNAQVGYHYGGFEFKSDPLSAGSSSRASASFTAPVSGSGEFYPFMYTIFNGKAIIRPAQGPITLGVPADPGFLFVYGSDGTLRIIEKSGSFALSEGVQRAFVLPKTDVDGYYLPDEYLESKIPTSSNAAYLDVELMDTPGQYLVLILYDKSSQKRTYGVDVEVASDGSIVPASSPTVSVAEWIETNGDSRLKLKTNAQYMLSGANPVPFTHTLDGHAYIKPQDLPIFLSSDGVNFIEYTSTSPFPTTWRTETSSWDELFFGHEVSGNSVSLEFYYYNYGDYQWFIDWGDGGPITQSNFGNAQSPNGFPMVSRTYDAPGTYTIRLFPGNPSAGGTSVAKSLPTDYPEDPVKELQVTVGSGGADFSSSVNKPFFNYLRVDTYAPNSVQLALDALHSSDSSIDLTIDWGDGTVQTINDVTRHSCYYVSISGMFEEWCRHSYNEPGTYTITITATDSAGRSTVKTLSATV